MKQELGVHRHVVGQIDSLPSNTARISMEVVGATGGLSAAPRRTSEPARKYPPTKLYIEDEPEKKVETFMRWKQHQRGQEGEEEEDTMSETRHLSELEREIDSLTRREMEVERRREREGDR